TVPPAPPSAGGWDDAAGGGADTSDGAGPEAATPDAPGPPAGPLPDAGVGRLTPAAGPRGALGGGTPGPGYAAGGSARRAADGAPRSREAGVVGDGDPRPGMTTEPEFRSCGAFAFNRGDSSCAPPFGWNAPILDREPPALGRWTVPAASRAWPSDEGWPCR